MACDNPVPVDAYAPLYQALIETLRRITGITEHDHAMEYSAARVTAGLYVQTCLAEGSTPLPLKWAITALRSRSAEPIPQDAVLDVLVAHIDALPESAHDVEEIAVARSLVRFLKQRIPV